MTRSTTRDAEMRERAAQGLRADYPFHLRLSAEKAGTPGHEFLDELRIEAQAVCFNRFAQARGNVDVGKAPHDARIVEKIHRPHQQRDHRGEDEQDVEILATIQFFDHDSRDGKNGVHLTRR